MKKKHELDSIKALVLVFSSVVVLWLGLTIYCQFAIPTATMSTYEAIMVVISLLNTLSLVALIIQLIFSKQDSKAIHEEKRREKTIEVMAIWNNATTKDARLAEIVVNQLSPEQCRCLYNNQKFKVKREIYRMLCGFCNNYECKNLQKIPQLTAGTDTESERSPKRIKKYWVEGEQLNQLRWNVTNYLNNLEIVFTAYHQGIVDKKIIETQFSFLYRPEKNKNALSTYRNIAGGGNSYPAIELFIKKLQKNYQTEIEEKTEIK